MRLTRIRLAAPVAAFLLGTASQAFGEPPAWPEEPHVQELMAWALPETDFGWDGRTFARRGTRAATYTAAGLRWRDGPHDRAAAAAILRGVLDLQYADGPDSTLYGVWRRHLGETVHDSNWREFIGCGLILIVETFPDRLPPDLFHDAQAALLRAAEGAAQRDVGAAYTNIALMSAMLLDYAGTKQGRQDLQRAGREKAEAIYERFRRHKTFEEYNSPTYYGVNLMALAEAVNKLGQAPSRPLIFQGFRRFLSEPVPFFHSLALWRQHAWSPRIRELGRLMEAELWREIATFYHADMKNLCGPFVRANGMDMTQYFALTGLWIALVVGDPARTPIPTSRAPHGERIFGPVFARLQPRVPEDVLPHLRGFAGPRRFERTFGQSEATVLIEKDFMMGAAALPRRWEQHHPATIHWLIRPGQHVGWILLTGLNNDVAPRGAAQAISLGSEESAATVDIGHEHRLNCPRTSGFDGWDLHYNRPSAWWLSSTHDASCRGPWRPPEPNALSTGAGGMGCNTFLPQRELLMSGKLATVGTFSTLNRGEYCSESSRS
jgi:hypothetical protein